MILGVGARGERVVPGCVSDTARRAGEACGGGFWVADLGCGIGLAWFERRFEVGTGMVDCAHSLQLTRIRCATGFDRGGETAEGVRPRDLQQAVAGGRKRFFAQRRQDAESVRVSSLDEGQLPTRTTSSVRKKTLTFGSN
jgi:hypothetical protein